MDKLEEVLNDEAREGWQLKSITRADVNRRIGPRPLITAETALTPPG